MSVNVLHIIYFDVFEVLHVTLLSALICWYKD